MDKVEVFSVINFMVRTLTITNRLKSDKSGSECNLSLLIYEKSFSEILSVI